MEMTQALSLVETESRMIGNDMQTLGYLASTSGGLARQAAMLAGTGIATVSTPSPPLLSFHTPGITQQTLWHTADGDCADWGPPLRLVCS